MELGILYKQPSPVALQSKGVLNYQYDQLEHRKDIERKHRVPSTELQRNIEFLPQS